MICLRIAIPIVFIIEVLMNMSIIYSDFGRYILAGSTFICCLSFIIFCYIISKQLEDFYIISETYKKEITYLFYAMIALVIVRVIYNVMNSIIMESFLSDFKNGTNCNGKSIIPDVGASWYILYNIQLGLYFPFFM